MSTTFQIIIDIVAAIAGLIISVGAIAYVYAQYKNGRSDADSSENKDAEIAIKIKDQAIISLQQEVTRINEVVVEMGKQIAELKTELKIKDETIERYLQLLQNRNPELESFIHTATETLKKIADTQKVGIDAIHALMNKPTGTTVINQPNA